VHEGDENGNGFCSYSESSVIIAFPP
jgi:hypothetical protein